MPRMAWLTNKCSCRRVICSVILLILIAVAGGLLLWQFLPQEQKETLGLVAESGANVINNNGTPQTAPPPDYQFIQCTQQSINNNNCCNGVVGLCDYYIHEILYAGLHNAQSSVEDGFLIAPNHQYNMISALDYGYRLLNIDLGSCRGSLQLVHGLCKLGTVDPTKAFTDINRWLDANPTEILIIPVQIDSNAGGEGVDLGKFYNLLNSIDGFIDKMFWRRTGQNWPTLGELIQYNQRIVMFHYNTGFLCSDEGINCPPGFHDWFTFASETPFEYKDKDDFIDTSYSCKIDRGRTVPRFFALNLFTTVPSKSISSTFLNTQTFLENQIQQCSALNNGLDVNGLFVDWFDQGEVPKVVQTHNIKLAQNNTGTRKKYFRLNT